MALCPETVIAQDIMARRLRPGPVAIPFALGAALGFYFVLTGSPWALPFVAATTFGVAALVHVFTGKGPGKAEVEAIRNNLWLRYHPRTAEEPAAAAARKTVEAATAEDGGRRRQVPAEIEELERTAADAEGDSDRALAYVERVIDRQINKLRGVLSFDALIIAFLSLERQRLDPSPLGLDYATGCLALLTLVLLLLVVSSVMCLDLFRVIWSPADNFQDFRTEHGTTVRLVAERTTVVERAVRLSEIAVVGAVACFLLIELQTAFVPPPAVPSPAEPQVARPQTKSAGTASQLMPVAGAPKSPKIREKAKPDARGRPVRRPPSERPEA